MDEFLDVPQSVRTPVIKEVFPPEGTRFTVNQAIGAIRAALKKEAHAAWITQGNIIFEKVFRSPHFTIPNDSTFSAPPHWHDINVVLACPTQSRTPTLILPYEPTRIAALSILRKYELESFIRIPDHTQTPETLDAPHLLDTFRLAAKQLHRDSAKAAKGKLLPASREIQQAVEQHAFICRWDGERPAGMLGFRAGVLHCRSVLENFEREEKILFFPES